MRSTSCVSRYPVATGVIFIEGISLRSTRRVLEEISVTERTTSWRSSALANHLVMYSMRLITLRSEEMLRLWRKALRWGDDDIRLMFSFEVVGVLSKQFGRHMILGGCLFCFV